MTIHDLNRCNVCNTSYPVVTYDGETYYCDKHGPSYTPVMHNGEVVLTPGPDVELPKPEFVVFDNIFNAPQT